LGALVTEKEAVTFFLVLHQKSGLVCHARMRGSVMPSEFVILKRDGTPTVPSMKQTQAENYLSRLITMNRVASLKQALNDISGNGGKATNAYKHNGVAVKHASSGDGQQSVSLFYTVAGNVATIIAMGEHLTLPYPQVRYKLSDYGQPNGDFKSGATIILK
jgi:hypothetical protein